MKLCYYVYINNNSMYGSKKSLIHIQYNLGDEISKLIKII